MHLGSATCGFDIVTARDAPGGVSEVFNDWAPSGRIKRCGVDHVEKIEKGLIGNASIETSFAKSLASNAISLSHLHNMRVIQTNDDPEEGYIYRPGDER